MRQALWAGPAPLVRGSSRRITIYSRALRLDPRISYLKALHRQPCLCSFLFPFLSSTLTTPRSIHGRFVGFISSPSSRHDNVPKRCRNQSSSFKELMRFPRLPLRGRNRALFWFVVFLLPLQHPVCRFRKVSSDCADGRLMTPVVSNVLVQSSDVAVGPTTTI
jgi:hypothetical protein